MGEQMAFSSLLDTSKPLPLSLDSQICSYLPPDQLVDHPDDSLPSTTQQSPDYRANIEANWIFDGGSIGSFALPENGDISVFDFEFPIDFSNTNL